MMSRKDVNQSLMFRKGLQQRRWRRPPLLAKERPVQMLRPPGDMARPAATNS